MSGRNEYEAQSAPMPRSVRVLVGILAVVALAGTAAFAVTFNGVSDRERSMAGTAVPAGVNCQNPDAMVVVADPSIAPAVEAVAATVPTAELGCASFTVTSQEPSATADAITRGGAAPALWMPDSGEWLDKVAGGGAPHAQLSSSVASTPVVTVHPPDASVPAGWADVLRAPGLHIGDPLTSAVSSAPIVAAFAEAQASNGDATSVSAALVPVAQAQYGNLKETDPSGRIQTVDGQGGIAVTTEQAFDAYRSDHRESLLTASVPASGAVFMNYPLASFSGDLPEKSEAGRLLLAALSSDVGRSVLSEFGFRGPDRAPLSNSGVGVVTSLAPSDPTVVTKALARYELLSRPSRALAVVDVSGSMDYMQDGVTRMAATAEAGDIAIRMFPVNAQVGLWAFSVDLGDGTDYRELSPVQRMDAQDGDTDHRTALLSQIDGLPTIVGGGTGLYDSVLAAFRSVQQNYDPASINSVILLTDGANDDPSGISRQELLDTLSREQDPARPVPVITIGVTGDADTDVLEQISAVTGGNSHFAPTPADIPKVFVGAISGRAG